MKLGDIKMEIWMLRGIGCVVISVVMWAITIFIMNVFEIERVYVTEPLGFFFLIAVSLLGVGAFLLLYDLIIESLKKVEDG